MRTELLRQFVRTLAPRFLYAGAARRLNQATFDRAAGSGSFRALEAHAEGGRPTDVRSVALKGLAHPVLVRGGTSDFANCVDVLARELYGTTRLGPETKYVVDAGAYAGYSAIFFLHRFPAARVFAIEADAANFAHASRNLKPYADRVRLVHAGLWSANTTLDVVSSAGTDGHSAREGAGPQSIAGYDMARVLSESGFPHVDLFKCDIEGAESEVFGKGDLGWLAQVKEIHIELHGDGNVELVTRTLTQRGFSVRRYRELYVFEA